MGPAETCDVNNFPAPYTDARYLCYIQRLYVILEPDEEFMERIRDVIVLLWPLILVRLSLQIRPNFPKLEI